MFGMVIRTSERFNTVVAWLNSAFDGLMVFQLAGSLTEKPASFHDEDIIVYPKFPFDLTAFSRGCEAGGIQIIAIDGTSTTPFPGRPEGQDRIQLKMGSGEVIDLFLPKGSLGAKRL
jgi:hypothetical protein